MTFRFVEGVQAQLGGRESPGAWVKIFSWQVWDLAQRETARSCIKLIKETPHDSFRSESVYVAQADFEAYLERLKAASALWLVLERQ